jgi:hypothetical protein
MAGFQLSINGRFWVSTEGPGEYSWCSAAQTIVDCTTAHTLPTARLRSLHAAGELEFVGDIRPAHVAAIDAITKNSKFLSPEQKRWIVPW